MHLEKLDLQGVRNLQPDQFELNPRVNFFYGANGSGKTSLLEAIYLLGRGRSFRTRNPLSVMSKADDQFFVVGFLRKSADKAPIPVGMQRKRTGELLLKVAGEMVYSSSALAETLPLLLLNSDTFLLLDGGPKGRRHYLDWGVFHVEHSYQALWGRFQKALKQRNSLLRHDRIDQSILTTWDKELVSQAEQVDCLRRRYIEKLFPVIQRVLASVTEQEMPDIEFKYYSGWDKAKTLAETLKLDQQRDQQFGVTHHGPHRADIRVRIGRSAAGDLLSRGQAKILVSAMQIAQGQLFQAETGRRCLYLLDDLPSELDKKHRESVSQLLCELGSQVFITGVDRDDLLKAWPTAETGEYGLFHVEHGCIKQEKLS